MANERIEQLKSILEQDPSNTLTRYALGMEYSNAGDVDASVAEFQALVTANPGYANAYFMAAQALSNAERKEEAKDWLRRGIAAAQKTNNKHAESEMQAMLDELEY